MGCRVVGRTTACRLHTKHHILENIFIIYIQDIFLSAPLIEAYEINTVLVLAMCRLR